MITMISNCQPHAYREQHSGTSTKATQIFFGWFLGASIDGYRCCIQWINWDYISFLTLPTQVQYWYQVYLFYSSIKK